MELDNWQQDVMNCKGNMVLRSGRQVGKSTIIGLKAATYALNNPSKLVMVISKTEKQALLLFAKILFNINQIDKKMIKKGKYRPTKTKIQLTNNTIIHCLCCGDSGYGIMGFTIDLLIADEAAFIPELVWLSVIPSLAITRGEIWLLSTPFLKEGYYYECFTDPSFTSFHTSSEDCPRKDQNFLNRQKETLTRAEYAQWYLGEFVDEFQRLFPEDLINQVCSLSRNPTALTSMTSRDFFLGVDVAGMGSDESTFEILDGTTPNQITQVESIITIKTRTTDTTNKIISLDDNYKFSKIGIDDGGMGVGVFDQLLIKEQTRRKVVAINNASRTITYEDKPKRKRILKEDLYINLLGKMEREEIKLLDDREIKDSLNSIHYDTSTGKISGSYSHIAEGLIRALHLIITKPLNIYIF